MAEGALSDVKVLDFTHMIAGPYCTKLMADYGADVTKVERPDGGDGARRLGPFPGDNPHNERSGLFLHLNTNKRGVTLDLKTSAGNRIARRLAAEADVVVESFRPGVMSRLGLDYATLSAENPALVMTSISNFGQTGPYSDFRGSEIVLYGMGGEMYSAGLEDREPIKLGGNMVQYQAGAAASVATMAALFAARAHGDGQHVDVSIMETQVGSIDRRMSSLIAYQYTGEISHRTPFGVMGYPIGVYPCADGYVEVTGGIVYFRRVVKMLGQPAIFDDPKWYTPQAQTDPDLREQFEEFFIPWCLERTKYEIWYAAQEARVLSGPINSMEDLVGDPSFNDRGAFAEFDHPSAGRLTYPGRPFVMDRSPWAARMAAPMLGQHNEEVLGKLGYDRAALVRLRETGAI